MQDFELQALISEVLPALGWQETDRFEDSIALHPDLSLHAAGLACVGRMPLSGSAASRHGNSLGRACAELLERVFAIEAIDRFANADEILASSIDRKQSLSCSVSDIFPQSADPKMAYAKSNGVGFHDTWERACKVAALELIERHITLSSWMGRLPVTKLSPPKDLAAKLAPNFNTELVHFGSYPTMLLGGERVQVCGYFLLPNDESLPLTFGLGAGANLAIASEKAIEEGLQRLAFLWGEEIPASEPPFSAGAYYHQEYYLYPANHRMLHDWLNNRFYEPQMPTENEGDFYFVDLTPPQFQGRFYAVKAVQPKLLPLVFGDTAGHPAYAHLSAERRIHPIA